MSGPSSASSFYRFDVARGIFETSRDVETSQNRMKTRVLQIPEDVLSKLFSVTERQGNTASFRHLGVVIAKYTSTFLSERFDDSSPQHALHAMSMALRFFGLGNLSMECWGDLLVLRLKTPPKIANSHIFVSEVLSGLLRECSGMEATCVSLHSDPTSEQELTQVTCAVVHPASAPQVATWVSEGRSLSDIVGSLQEAA